MDLPSRMTVTRSAWVNTSSILWVIRMQAMPRSFRVCRMEKSLSASRLVRGEVGSSSTRICGSLLSARAMDTSCCWLALSWRRVVFTSTSSSPTICMYSRASALSCFQFTAPFLRLGQRPRNRFSAMLMSRCMLIS